MKKITFLTGCLAILFFASCETKKKSQNTNEEKHQTIKTKKIQFEELNRYFVKNSELPSELRTKKISSQEEFDKTFGAATVMGKNGKPADLNFDKDIVLAVYGPSTTKKTDIKADRLEYGNNILTLHYNVTEGAEQSFSTKPLLLLKISKKYDGFTKFEKE